MIRILFPKPTEPQPQDPNPYGLKYFHTNLKNWKMLYDFPPVERISYESSWWEDDFTISRRQSWTLDDMSLGLVLINNEDDCLEQSFYIIVPDYDDYDDIVNINLEIIAWDLDEDEVIIMQCLQLHINYFNELTRWNSWQKSWNISSINIFILAKHQWLERFWTNITDRMTNNSLSCCKQCLHSDWPHTIISTFKQLILAAKSWIKFLP